MPTINGKQIAVESSGEGDVILMVHGLGGTSNVWGSQANALQKFFKVIRPDLEGSGRSPATGDLSIQGFVDDLVALLDSENIEAAHLIGHSMGTIICQHMAVQHPARVKSLVLLGPVHGLPDPARDAIRGRGEKARAEGMTELADILVQAGTSKNTQVHNEVTALFVRELLMRQDPEAYAKTCDALAGSQAADLSAIQCPVLILTGDEDGVAPPAATRTMARGIPDCALEILGRCGHWTPLERPNKVNESVINFLI
ncbi:MAG: alpha/beta fold hydrolase [Opitutales bacterium]|nr:alpha/beta fold hydrolase [Opitutales bacterium]